MEKKFTVYLSGPMTGMPNLNFASFDKLKVKLTRMGFNVVSPADLDRARGPLPYPAALKDDIKHLLDCDAVYMLLGWHMSFGARLEMFIAQAIGLRVFFEADM
jgi:nucleoside 2-deoxyribosyltransferase